MCFDQVCRRFLCLRTLEYAARRFAIILIFGADALDCQHIPIFKNGYALLFKVQPEPNLFVGEMTGKTPLCYGLNL